MENNSIRILVCDDELDVREMVREYLMKRGFKVSTAGNGNELRAVLSSGGIDLIILDINMPGEDGLSVLRSLRPENQIPVVMPTAAEKWLIA
jgi:DNA-binding response OmpR family regulator